MGYPDAVADDFPAPPRTIDDKAGRAIDIRRAGPADRDALLAMYGGFHPEDRAQGIPPVKDEGLRRWIDTLLGEGSLNVLAWHDGDVVGHAVLVPDDSGAYELAIFVLRAYQGATIGTELLRSLLGLGQAEEVEKVWLTVERWNEPAVRLYRNVGFEMVESESFELEMTIRLA